MGGRYFITGAQLGIIRSFSKNIPEIKKVLDEIYDEQFIFNSGNHIANDIKRFIKLENENGKI